MKELGLTQLNISYDRYHAEFQGPEPTINIARAAQQLRVPFNIDITRTQDENDLHQIVAPFDEIPNAMLRFYDVQPIGRARDFDLSTLRPQTNGFCNACFSPAFTEDGRVTACNDPAYFSPPSSPLAIGSLEKESMETLLQRHQSDPILETIRTFGPARLLEEARQIPELKPMLRDDYRGMCDLCLHLTNNPVVVKHLREKFSDSYSAAQRLAIRKVIEGERRSGSLTREYVNNLGAAKVFFEALTRDLSPSELSEWSREADRVLGRADFDWHHWLELLTSCGFSVPLQKTLNTEVMTDFAPAFFTESVRKKALYDSMRGLMQRDVIREIADVLRENNARAVLLKGSAIAALALEKNATPNQIVRASEDIDIWLDTQSAPIIWRKLVERGFAVPANELGLSPNQKTAHLHQLPQLGRDGVYIEIHQTLLPPYCGAPTGKMLEQIQPLKSPELVGLWTLDPAAMIVHSLLHGSKHLFTHNLKSAFDVQWICDYFGEIDWERVERLGQSTRMNRGFWVPLNLLSRGLDLPVPQLILEHVPRDKRQQQLEKFASRLIYGATKFPYDHNPFVRWGLYMLLNDSLWSRILLARAFLFGRESAEFRAKTRELGLEAQRPSRLSHVHPRKFLKAYNEWKKLG